MFLPLSDVSCSECCSLRERLGAVDTERGLDGFPVSDLVAASTFDEAQAKALGAALLRELAVVQGPPGTGEEESVSFWTDGGAGATRHR